MAPKLFSLLLLSLSLHMVGAQNETTCLDDPEMCDEEFAQDWLDNVYEEEERALLEEVVQADWNYNVDINDANAAASTQAKLEIAAYDKEVWVNYINVFDLDSFEDENLVRRLEKLKVLGESALPDDDVETLSNTVNEMVNIYNTARVCPYDNQDCDEETEGLPLEPGNSL